MIIRFFPDGDAGGGAATPAPATATPADWRDSLPADLKDVPSLKNVNSVADLAKGYVHAQRTIGNNVAIPGKDSKPEEWAAFFNKAGRPETPDKYDFGKIEGEDKVPIPAEFKKDFLAKAHEFGLSNRQAASLYSWYVGTTGKSLSDASAAIKSSVDQATATLKTEWGDAFDQNLDIAKAALKEFGGDDAVELMNETGLGNDPRVIKLFHKVGKAIGDEKLFTQGKTSTGKLTPAEADASIAIKLSDKAFMDTYLNADAPGHAEAVQVLKSLYEAKNSGK